MLNFRTLLDFFPGWLVSVRELEKTMNQVAKMHKDDKDEALTLVHAVYNRLESLHQALCLATFAATAASFLKWFETLSGSVETGVYVAGTIACALLCIVLYRAVRLAVVQRMQTFQKIIGS